MIILIVSCVILVLGIYLDNRFCGYKECVGFILTLVFGTVLFISIISISMERINFYNRKVSYYAFTETLDSMRKKEDSIENAAIQLKISDWNEYLAKKKYWNNTLLDIWIPDEIEHLNFIK
jgi:hypothetical protein